MIPIYCLVREYTNDYLDKKIINFSEKNPIFFQWDKINPLYYEFIQIWNSLFKIDIFEFRSLIKNEIVLPRLKKCEFDRIFFNINDYINYLENNKDPFFLYSVDNDDFLIPHFCNKITPYLINNDLLEICFWDHYDWLSSEEEIKIHTYKVNEPNWQIHTNNSIFKNINTLLIQHWEVQVKFFPDTIYKDVPDKKYLSECFSLKNTNLSAYTTCISLRDNESNGPKLLITNRDQLLERYKKCLNIPKNFYVLPYIFQKDVENMFELYKTLL